MTNGAAETSALCDFTSKVMQYLGRNVIQQTTFGVFYHKAVYSTQSRLT